MLRPDSFQLLQSIDQLRKNQLLRSQNISSN